MPTEIRVSLSKKQLQLIDTTKPAAKTFFEAALVSGCDGSGTPPGVYKAGAWVRDKTNPVHGPTPWSQSPWKNPYGPYFLQLMDGKTGRYTSYGIHGTRGPLLGNFEKPPVPEWMLKPFLGDEQSKFLYCSHGCVRLSNRNICRLFEILTSPRGAAEFNRVIRIEK